jgi:acyl-CoA thioester hydrolase
MPTWSAPVRYAEVDQQGVVFNSHYLLYCDEAMGAFCAQRGVLDLAEKVQLVSSALTWQGSARWGDVLDVQARCTRLGTSSFTMTFELAVRGAAVCTVETVYVHTDLNGRSVPLPDEDRTALQA